MPNVAYDVPMVPQPDPLHCWAACLAMMLSWRDRTSWTIDRVVEASPEYPDSGPKATNHRALARFGLEVPKPHTPTADSLAGMLLQHGPLWAISVIGWAKFHATVLTGIVAPGDGTARLKVNDPVPVGLGSRYEIDMSTLVSDFRALKQEFVDYVGPDHKPLFYLAHFAAPAGGQSRP